MPSLTLWQPTVAATEVKHALGMPLTAVSEVNGKKGARECAPFSLVCCPAPVSKMMGFSTEATGKNAKALLSEAGAPPTADMER